MKQITITVPDNCELKQNGNTYIIVEKEKKLTYEDIAKELFKDEKAYYICSSGIIATAHCFPNALSNCTSEIQAEKLLAINKLMNVAKYLNCDWKPDWENTNEIKYTIAYDYKNNRLISDITCMAYNWSLIYFKSKKLAQQAIDILGEDTIRLALCTDY